MKFEVLRANKIHTCTVCGKEIPPSAEYLLLEFMQNGVWTDNKVCVTCAEKVINFKKLPKRPP